MGRHAARAGRPDRRAVAGILCLVLAALTVTIPLALMIGNGRAASQLTGAHAQAVENADTKRVAREYAAARAYNRRLYERGQSVLGEARDPWTGASGSGSDASYRRQLDFPSDGIMSTVRYPRLGIDLPIRHGTSQATLDAGAGHMYGTSLPVGGGSTHTVISAHSGLADRLMFDRLRGLGGEARKGDVFYLVTAGHTLAYRVVDISVVDPSDFSKLRIVDGRDLATLLTCTPYGVNDKGGGAERAGATRATAPGTYNGRRGRFRAFPFPSGPSASLPCSGGSPLGRMGFPIILEAGDLLDPCPFLLKHEAFHRGDQPNKAPLRLFSYTLLTPCPHLSAKDNGLCSIRASRRRCLSSSAKRSGRLSSMSNSSSRRTIPETRRM